VRAWEGLAGSRLPCTRGREQHAARQGGMPGAGWVRRGWVGAAAGGVAPLAACCSCSLLPGCQLRLRAPAGGRGRLLAPGQARPAPA
jgi:hypothetical protein